MNELTVKEYAARERVSERAVWRWIAKGAVDVRRTPGGRVRIQVTGRMPILTLTTQSKTKSDEVRRSVE